MTTSSKSTVAKVPKASSWRDILAADLKAFPPRSNVSGVLMSRPHGGYRLALQTEWGDEYVSFAQLPSDAWEKLSRMTGREVSELKRMPLTQVQ